MLPTSGREVEAIGLVVNIQQTLNREPSPCLSWEADSYHWKRRQETQNRQHKLSICFCHHPIHPYLHPPFTPPAIMAEPTRKRKRSHSDEGSIDIQMKELHINPQGDDDELKLDGQETNGNTNNTPNDGDDDDELELITEQMEGLICLP